MDTGKTLEFVILFLLTSAFAGYGLVRQARSLLSGLYLILPPMDQHFTPIPATDKPSFGIGAQPLPRARRSAIPKKQRGENKMQADVTSSGEKTIK